MKKYLSVLCFVVFITSSIYGQTINCKISGTLTDHSQNKYAYLYISQTKSLSITPIINDKFLFNIPRQKELTLGILFLGTDSLKTYDDQIKERIPGIPNSRMIVIEDLEISIPASPDRAVVKGGILNKDLDQMQIASKSLNYNLFFDQHPDSPVSIIFLSTLVQVNKIPDFAIPSFDSKAIYNGLSERLKSSPEGKELWKKIDN